ncbi:MAG: hypothetical protein ABIH76_06870 [Candidatus Bathyarchaeota archaeon]
MKCAICGKTSEGEYCKWHKRAYMSLQEKFKDWQKVLEINWEEFLEEIKNNPNTGTWGKEVATYIIRKGENSPI